MHSAVFAWLVSDKKEFYSVYISCRAASDGPLACLLFDELNHRLPPRILFGCYVRKLSTSGCRNTRRLFIERLLVSLFTLQDYATRPSRFCLLGRSTNGHGERLGLE